MIKLLRILCGFLVATLVMLFVVAPIIKAKAQTPPHIIVIMCDDCGANEFKPEIMPETYEHIVNRGVNFTNANANNSLCGPNNASFWTGMTLENHGLKTCNDVQGVQATHLWNDYNLAGWPAKEIGPRLNTAGYYTAMVGKYNAFASQWKTAMPQGGWNYWFAQTDGTYWNPEYAHNGWIGRIAGYGLYQLRTRAKIAIDQGVASGKPIFLAFKPFNPHLSVDRSEKSYPPSLESFSLGQPLPARPDLWLSGNGKVSHLNASPPLTTEEKAIMEGFHSEGVKSTKALDIVIGQLIDHVQSAGIYANTCFMFTSDNSNWNGAHGMGPSKLGPYRATMNVPLSLYCPGTVAQSRGDMVQTYDILPTLMDIAGVPFDPSIDGRSFKTMLQGGCVPWRRWAYSSSFTSSYIWRRASSMGWFNWRFEAIYSQAKTFIRWPNIQEEEAYEDKWMISNVISSMPASHIAARNSIINQYQNCTGAYGNGTKGSCHNIEELTCP